MNKENFSNWVSWKDRNLLKNHHFPGIYCIAISDENITNLDFKWTSQIVYIGMSNSIGGIKSRLRQFDNTIIGKVGHGGADRMRFKYENYEELVNRLYVSICPFACNVTSLQPEGLRVMGKVESFEYECLANYLEIFGQLPEFNDKKKSPKFSLNNK